jgi:hypothetical protein
MADEGWLDAERAWALEPRSQERLEAAIVARRRAGVVVPLRLLVARRSASLMFEPIEAPRGSSRVRYWSTQEDVRSRTLIEGSLVPRHSYWGVTADPFDRIWGRVRDQVAALAIPGLEIESPSDMTLTEVGALDSLRVVAFVCDGRVVTSRGVTELGRLRSLEHLELTLSSGVRRDFFAPLRDLPNLTSVVIESHDPSTELDLTPLRRLTSVVLSLGNVGAALRSLADRRDLESLSLRSEDLVRVDELSSLEGCTRLRRLEVSGPGVDGAPAGLVKSLRALGQLEEVSVQCRGLPPESHAELTAALPRCRLGIPVDLVVSLPSGAAPGYPCPRCGQPLADRPGQEEREAPESHLPPTGKDYEWVETTRGYQLECSSPGCRPFQFVTSRTDRRYL